MEAAPHDLRTTEGVRALLRERKYPLSGDPLEELRTVAALQQAHSAVVRQQYPHSGRSYRHRERPTPTDLFRIACIHGREALGDRVRIARLMAMREVDEILPAQALIKSGRSRFSQGLNNSRPFTDDEIRRIAPLVGVDEVWLKTGAISGVGWESANGNPDLATYLAWRGWTRDQLAEFIAAQDRGLNSRDRVVIFSRKYLGSYVYDRKYHSNNSTVIHSHPPQWLRPFIRAVSNCCSILGEVSQRITLPKLVSMEAAEIIGTYLDEIAPRAIDSVTDTDPLIFDYLASIPYFPLIYPLLPKEVVYNSDPGVAFTFS